MLQHIGCSKKANYRRVNKSTLNNTQLLQIDSKEIKILTKKQFLMASMVFKVYLAYYNRIMAVT